MKKIIKIVFIVVAIILFAWVLKYFYDANNKAPELFGTETPFYKLPKQAHN